MDEEASCQGQAASGLAFVQKAELSHVSIWSSSQERAVPVTRPMQNKAVLWESCFLDIRI